MAADHHVQQAAGALQSPLGRPAGCPPCLPTGGCHVVSGALHLARTGQRLFAGAASMEEKRPFTYASCAVTLDLWQCLQGQPHLHLVHSLLCVPYRPGKASNEGKSLCARPARGMLLGSFPVECMIEGFWKQPQIVSRRYGTQPHVGV